MNIYGIEECEPCNHGTRFSQGMYCFPLSRYISEDEVYSQPCGKFSVQPAVAPDREHPAVSEGKSAKQIQKGYQGYLRSHRGR